MRSPPKMSRAPPLWCFIFVLIRAACGQELTPPMFNLAAGRRVFATATCGEGVEEPELYCNLVGMNKHGTEFKEVEEEHLHIQGMTCDICDPNSEDKRHPPEYAVDGDETWWQSPPLSRDMKYNEVNLTIDLGQEFHVAYVLIKMGNSPRPAVWALERSADNGVTYSPWQYFASTATDCELYFGSESLKPITQDDSVTCTTQYSKIVPLEGGEITISLLDHRPSMKNFFNSTRLQEWTRATNVRLRLLRTKNLLGHLMSMADQDPTTTRRYFYSIKDISIGGRCRCNGHADVCDILDPEDPYHRICRCQHNTCGHNCEVCCPGYEQKAWRQSQSNKPFSCEPCNCHGHADKCVYDPMVDEKRLSVDIQGNYEGGGVCQECRDNTEGINCHQCVAGYYRPYGKHLNETDVCQPCQCAFHYATGNCAEGTGKCECRPEYTKPDCNSCAFGYFGYPNCEPCKCHMNGTLDFYCEPASGQQCPCKENYAGDHCDTCAQGYYNFPTCSPCECNAVGSLSDLCEVDSGNCTCRNNFAGRTCDSCADGYYNYPRCTFCNCDIRGTEAGICDKTNGSCLCKEGYTGARCDQCKAGYYGYPDCKLCGCSAVGSSSTACDVSGKCPCLVNFGGKTCSQCSPGFYQYPQCKACNCDSHGNIGVSCDDDGKCQCEKNFGGDRCERCKEGLYNFPICEECNCNPEGVLKTFAGCGSLPAGELCECKPKVQGRICDECRPLYWNLKASNPDGCEDCDCYTLGTIGGIKNCNPKSGQCVCKATAMNRKCDACVDGTYALQDNNLFGCTECACDIGGSINNLCNKFSGQCLCQPRVTGQTCNQPLQAHYYPTLHHYQFEIEDGHTPAFSPVRFGFDNNTFPNFSWRGYAVFSPLQSEIIQEVNIQEPSIYQLILRYVNPNNETVVGKIRIVSDTVENIEQHTQVQLKPTLTPSFVTVSGITGNIPSPLVMYPGRISISIAITNKINPAAYIDYFVLLPQAFYEPSILVERELRPCTRQDQRLCRHFNYPLLTQYDSVLSEGAYTSQDDVREPPRLFLNAPEDLSALNSEELPLLNQDQPKLRFDMRITKPGPHVLVLSYVTPRPHTQDSAVIQLEASSQTTVERGNVRLHDCPYTTPCRATVLDKQGKVSVFEFDTNYISVELTADENPTNNASAAIQKIVAIPEAKWSMDHIQPKTECVRKDGQCVQATFPTSPETKKIEAESGLGPLATQLPGSLADNKTGLVYLDHKDAMVDIAGTVNNPGAYVFVMHFYQPDFPEFDMDVLIQNGQFYEAQLPVKHCPARSGCRAVVQQTNGNRMFTLEKNFVATFKEPNHKSVWLDYILLIPANEFNENIINELPYSRAKEFIDVCGKNHFYLDNSTSEFCKKATFSMTISFLHEALPCQCDIDGSKSFECEQFGGQCQCKPNVIGRRCEMCATGYYGFPDCHPCNCPFTAVCDSYTGECICAARVIGKKCDQCEPNTFGYDPIIGCEECNCHPHGVNGTQQCDLFDGSCSCKENIVGRTCDHCVEGHWSFPYCVPCECDLRGTTIDICNQGTAECYCKKNVYGAACDVCKEGTFDIQADNVDGCTRCFCFGKTTKCSSSNLYRSQISSMDGWSLVGINVTKTVNLEPLTTVPEKVAADSIGVDLLVTSLPDKIIYFSAPQDYLGNKLVSYGGHLNYSIYYNTGAFASGFSAADLIVKGGDNVSLIYFSLEQPVEGETTQFSIHLVETNFKLPSGLSATREQFMQVLEKLKGIYIRAAYRDKAVVCRLTNVQLDGASTNFTVGTSVALSVEQCECPANYAGLSCEECADGYYRTSTGPYGGFCAPCNCHGHATTCDKVTGVCHDCQHNTLGDQCEQCQPGYHGNATQGTMADCLICACPLPITSNNFASGCDVSEDGERISCECQEGYMGARCQSCAAGYYGRPTKEGDYCKPCECSGNINRTDPGSCDSVTGECTGCLFNSAGDSCQYCAPGYYGNAVSLKNCVSCACSTCGTEECDHTNGTCTCKENVVGEKCESCALEHYGFSSCQGCQRCDCQLASESLQCDDTSGQCRCKPGVTGRTCNKCMPGFWNYTADGCVSCGCNTGFSVGVGCNALTGQCECLPGVIGEKCDHCPHRWVLVPGEGCFGCDSCLDGLLDTTDAMRNQLAPVIEEFETVAVSYFTTQRLHHINETVDQLSPNVSLVGQNGVDLDPLVSNLESLEQEARILNRKALYNKDSILVLNPAASDLLTDVLEADRNVRDVVGGVKDTVRNVANLAIMLDSGKGTQIDMALKEGDVILTKMIDLAIDAEKKEAANNTLTTAEDLLQKMKEASIPVHNTSNELNGLRDRIQVFKERIEDANNKTKEIDERIKETEELTAKNKNAQVSSKITALTDLTKDANDSLTNALEYTRNASALLDLTTKELEEVASKFVGLRKKNKQLAEKLDIDKEFMEGAEKEVLSAKQHSQTLLDQARDLDAVLNGTRSVSQNALNAANAYKNIDATIQQAEEEARSAKASSEDALEVSKGLDERIAESRSRSDGLLENARTSLDDAETLAGPELSATKARAEKSEEGAKDTISSIDDIVKALPEKTEAARNLSRNLAMTKKDRDLANDEVLRISNQIPEIVSLSEKLKTRPDDLKKLDEGVKSGLEELKQNIVHARDLANRLKLGANFISSSTLQLRNPDNIEELGLNTVASLYFQTNKLNGLLFYLGNEVGTSDRVRRSNTDDFMALQIENGYPILTLDLGSGPTQITSNEPVANDKWHQAIIERTGQTVRLKILEDGGTERVSDAVIPGSSCVLDLTKEHSKLFLGGVPGEFEIQPAVHHLSFEGKVEDFSLGGVPVGLWNFVQSSNVKPALERDGLPTPQSTGYSFNQDGYVVLNGTDYEFKRQSTVILSFKTKAKDGLLFLAHGKESFLSIEMKGGYVVYQFNLGAGAVSIISASTYNDNTWHSVEAGRLGKMGILKIDREVVEESTAPGDATDLEISDKLYVGGYPGKHNLPSVTSPPFDGCIDYLRLGEGSTVVNLHLNLDSFGVIPGCQDKVSSIISFSDGSDGSSYARWPNVTVTDNEMHLILRFKSPHPNGLVAYAEDGNAIFTLWLSGGELVLRSGGQEVATGATSKYDDGEWHTVLAIHNSSALVLIVDDRDQFKSGSPPNPIRFLSGNLYLGGVSSIIDSAASTNQFLGCIGDATLNGVVINFAELTDAPHTILGRCVVPSAAPSETSSQPTTSTEVTTTPSPTPVGKCVLPLYPAADPDVTPNSGFRFGTSKSSRIEYPTITGRFKNKFDFSIDIKTTSEQDGIIFYVADVKHIDYVALYVKDGQIHYSFNCGSGPMALSSGDKLILDGEWHTVEFSRQQLSGKLKIDGQVVAEGESKGSSKTLNIFGPFYLGGVPLNTSTLVRGNLGLNDTFVGCLRNLKSNNKLVQDKHTSSGVIPCSDKTESGVFFYNSGGYVKGVEQFRVGREMELKMDVKPRNISGLLLSVHSKKDYFILQMIDGSVKATVDNGKGPISAIYTPSDPYFFCDGQWHTIVAIKTKNVISVAVDSMTTDKPGLGPPGSSETDTNNAVFIGGHPFQQTIANKRLRGLETTVQYTGCIRNVIINNNNDMVNYNNVHGAVSLNICPTT
ncbi:hypothetical protein M8J76_001799 [Diaphorina citri]|nr:hypothetical protein M8J76_001799 [Diaphorina citri]